MFFKAREPVSFSVNVHNENKQKKNFIFVGRETKHPSVRTGKAAKVELLWKWVTKGLAEAAAALWSADRPGILP